MNMEIGLKRKTNQIKQILSICTSDKDLHILLEVSDTMSLWNKGYE